MERIFYSMVTKHFNSHISIYVLIVFLYNVNCLLHRVMTGYQSLQSFDTSHDPLDVILLVNGIPSSLVFFKTLTLSRWPFSTL